MLFLLSCGSGSPRLPLSALEVQVQEIKSLVQGEVDQSLPCTSPPVFLRLSGESGYLTAGSFSASIPDHAVFHLWCRLPPRTNEYWLCIAAPPLWPKKGLRIARLHLTNHNRPNSTATPVGLRPWRSSKKVSLLEGETGLTPARKTPPTRYGSCKSHTFPRYLRKRGEYGQSKLILTFTQGCKAWTEKNLRTIFFFSEWRVKQRRVVGPRGTRETKLTRNARAHFYI